MQYQMNEFLFAMILTELEDAVGKENCSTRAIDRVTHSVDYYWLSRMWADRGCRMPEADIIVCPKDAEEVSKVVKIANYYKLPVTTGVLAAARRAALYRFAAEYCLIPSV